MSITDNDFDEDDPLFICGKCKSSTKTIYSAFFCNDCDPISELDILKSEIRRVLDLANGISDKYGDLIDLSKLEELIK